MRGVMTMNRMDEWPVWQRWAALAVGWALNIGSFVLLIEAGGVPLRVLALVILGGGLWVLAYAGKAVLNERLRKVDRWQHRVVLPTMVAYIVLMLYVWPLEPHIHAVWLRWVVALLPALAVAIVVWAMASYIVRCDELERRQQLEAVGFAAGIVGLVSFALGLLVVTKLIVIDRGAALLMVFPALCFTFGCVRAWTRWRTRAR